MSGAAAVAALELVAVPGLPEIRDGDDLGAIIANAMDAAALALEDDDVLCISHKIVSKAEGRVRALADVVPGERAHELAAITGKDPRTLQVILDESTDIVRARDGLVIARHSNGGVMANAGIDQSNIGSTDGERVLCLPLDADASAHALREALRARFPARIGVLICDSVGRAWRRGVIGQALGAAGLPSLRDLRGAHDREGRALQVTFSAFADKIASAAELLMGEADEGRPVVRVRGLRWDEPPLPARALVRSDDEDLFR